MHTLKKKLLYTATLLLVTTATGRAEDPNIVALASSNPSFSTLVAALQAADLDQVVKEGTFTVFAPTNEAFDQLPEGMLEDLLKPENKATLQNVLKFHVIPGPGYELADLLGRKEWGTAAEENLVITFKQGQVRVNDAVLQTSDLRCANGVVHVIDQVLVPPVAPSNSIVDVAAAAGNFSTLLAAANAAGLAEALAGDGPFTVFAPTDAAFAKIPEKTLQDLLKPENKARLVDLLKYHVVPGRVTAGDALNAGKATALNQKALPFSFKEGALRAQWAKVLEADIEAENGLIHIIDSVMLPPGKKQAGAGLDSAKTIVQAIHHGVPMYNRGDAEGCASLYMQASKMLLKDEGLPAQVHATLRRVITKAEGSHCANTRAWTLRGGLDHTYAVLQHAMRDQSGSN